MTSIQIRIASPSLSNPVSLTANVERLENGDHVIAPYKTVGNLKSSISKELLNNCSLSLIFAGRIFNDSMSLMEAFSNYCLPLEPTNNEPVVVTVHAVVKFGDNCTSSTTRPHLPVQPVSATTTTTTAAATTPPQTQSSNHYLWNSHDNTSFSNGYAPISFPIHTQPVSRPTYSNHTPSPNIDQSTILPAPTTSVPATDTTYTDQNLHEYYDQYYRNYYMTQMQAILSNLQVSNAIPLSSTPSPTQTTQDLPSSPPEQPVQQPGLRQRLWDRVRGYMARDTPRAQIAPEVMAAVNFGANIPNQPVQLPRQVRIARWVQTVLISVLKWIMVSQLILRSETQFSSVLAWVVGIFGILTSMGWFDLIAVYAAVTQYALQVTAPRPHGTVGHFSRIVSAIVGLFASVIPGVHPLDPATTAAEHLRAMDVLNEQELVAEIARDVAM